MPQTDLMSLASPETEKEFSDLFAFAKKEGAVAETSRPHYRQRFAADPFNTRREIDLLIQGALFATQGHDAAHIVVREMPGYPTVSAPADVAYPESWV
jgi:hypothetical protein